MNNNDKPIYVKNCPILLPKENLKFFTNFRNAYDSNLSTTFEAGTSSLPNFKTGYSDSRFNGHNQSMGLNFKNYNIEK